MIPDGPDSATAVRAWLELRMAKKPNPHRSPDLAHEPVILIRPHDRLGEVVWDPQVAPLAKQTTSKARRKPVSLAPP